MTRFAQSTSYNYHRLKQRLINDYPKVDEETLATPWRESPTSTR